MTTAQSFDASVKRLEQSRLPFGTRLARRLVVLGAAFADDYESATISPRAATELVNFLEHTNLVEGTGIFGYPDLTVTPVGDLYAESRYADDCTLAIEFLDSGHGCPV
jgi:hypothetical protein